MAEANKPRLVVAYVATDELVPYARNSKLHPEAQVAQIAESIREFGFDDPVGVWTNADGRLEIVEGHGRVLAAKRLGVDQVPIVRLDHLTDEQRREYGHVHNQTTLTSGMDMDLIAQEMADIPEFDWRGFSFVLPEDQGFSNVDVDNSGEVDAEGFDDSTFDHQCPRCGFRFDDE
jgi:hypothetical protein